MKNLKIIYPGEILLNELIVVEQNQLNVSISKKLALITHHFQKILKSKPAPIEQLLELYQDYLLFKEALELYFKKEQQMLMALTEKVRERNISATSDLNNHIPSIVKKFLIYIKEELSGVTKKLTDIQVTYQAIKNSDQTLRDFFKELENLALFLNIHRNLLKFKYYQKLAPADPIFNYHLKAG